MESYDPANENGPVKVVGARSPDAPVTGQATHRLDTESHSNKLRNMMIALLLLILLSCAIVLPVVLLRKEEESDSKLESKETKTLDFLVNEDAKRVEEIRSFDIAELLRVEIEMDRAAWDRVRSTERTMPWGPEGGCMSSEAISPYSYEKVKSLKINGVLMENAFLRKKGFFGSNSKPKPSLKLKFKQILTASGDKLDRLTLQNDKQDIAHMRQFLSYAIFRKAGRPAPRISHATVSLNGVKMGVFQSIEPVKKAFLQRNFKNSDHDLYEGVLSDFQTDMMGTFQYKQGPSGSLSSGNKIYRGYMDETTLSSKVKLSEVASKGTSSDTCGGRDWVEIWNSDSVNTIAVGLFQLCDQQGCKNTDAYTFPPGVTLAPNEFKVLCRGTDFKFGINDSDVITLWNDDLEAMDSTGAMRVSEGATWSRGTSGWASTKSATPGEKNNVSEEAATPSVNTSLVEHITAVLETADGDDLEKQLSPYLHVDNFVKHWALEGLVKHGDSYSTGANNYLIYVGRLSSSGGAEEVDRVEFIPWGTDGAFSNDVTEFWRDTMEHSYWPASVYANSKLCNRFWRESPSLRRKYVDTMLGLLDTVWDEDAMVQEMDRVSDLIKDEVREIDHEKDLLWGSGEDDSKAGTWQWGLEQMKKNIRNRRAEILAEIGPEISTAQWPEWRYSWMTPETTFCKDTVGEWIRWDDASLQFKVFKDIGEKTFEEANAFCETQAGGKLAAWGGLNSMPTKVREEVLREIENKDTWVGIGPGSMMYLNGTTSVPQRTDDTWCVDESLVPGIFEESTWLSGTCGMIKSDCDGKMERRDCGEEMQWMCEKPIPDWTEIDGRFFKVYPGPLGKNWTDAGNECEKMDATLAIIDTQAQQQGLRRIAGADSIYLIGWHKKNGVWGWKGNTEASTDSIPWGDGRPNDSGDCGAEYNGDIYDAPCTWRGEEIPIPLGYACSKETL